LTAPVNFTLNSSVTNESCGAGDGAITIGATGPNTFIYTGDLTQDVTTGLSEGTYNVTITDAVTGCFIDETYIVENDVDFTFDVLVDPVSCGATNDGSIEITVTGPNSPYTILGDISSSSA